MKKLRTWPEHPISGLRRDSEIAWRTARNRIVRTIRAECLDHVMVIDERHLHAVLTEFIVYYNRDRPHRSLGLRAPIPSEPVTPGTGDLAARVRRLAPRLRSRCLIRTELRRPSASCVASGRLGSSGLIEALVSG